jgi:hypothetical protein
VKPVLEGFSPLIYENQKSERWNAIRSAVFNKKSSLIEIIEASSKYKIK